MNHEFSLFNNVAIVKTDSLEYIVLGHLKLKLLHLQNRTYLGLA